MKIKKRTVLYVSGSRADYGLMRRALHAIAGHPSLRLEIAAGGMHVMPAFGNTIQEIKRDGFAVHRLSAACRGDSRKAAADFAGNFLLQLSGLMGKNRPDFMLLLGDRAEMLAGAAVAAYQGIPAAHVHGGDVSATVDDSVRHAITKLAHLHFAATRQSARRIMRLGEDSWRVHVVGAPGLDGILHAAFTDAETLCRTYRIDRTTPLLLVIQHPAGLGFARELQGVRATMEAVRELGYRAIVVYPNTDEGSSAIIQVVESYRRHPFISIYRNIPRDDFLGLMRLCSVLVGNSSSGIIEAPSFGLPAVNIGPRQEGRERAGNVRDADYRKASIKKAIAICLTEPFQKKMEKVKSPYGDGKAGERIADILAKTAIDEKLLQKIIAY